MKDCPDTFSLVKSWSLELMGTDTLFKLVVIQHGGRIYFTNTLFMHILKNSYS